MEDQSLIRVALERNATAVGARPQIGRGTARTVVTLKPGLACEVVDGPWRLETGMTEKYAGTGTHPNPGVFGRTAFGACLAVGYAMWAARLGVPIDALSVTVEADYDAAGELGVADQPAGYSAVRYTVNVASSASEALVLHVLDTADRRSSWRDMLERPIPLTRSVRFEGR